MPQTKAEIMGYVIPPQKVFIDLEIAFFHRIWLTALQNKAKYQFLLRVFDVFLPFFLCKNKQIRKINCCPDSRFSGSICIRYHNRHCDFGINISFSHPETLESCATCTLQAKFKKATQGWKTERG